MQYDYEYDVYLSFTGADRGLKDDICKRLGERGFSSYDSDAYCMGKFRENYMEALDKSKIYLLLLTDNLRNDPAISEKGTLSEVRKELSLALELEAKNQLNIVILCMSEFFRYSQGFHDYRDAVGWMYYTNTRGFSTVYGALDEGGELCEKSFNDIESRIKAFIDKRNMGTPQISQAPKFEISSQDVAENGVFVGRERELESVLDAFGSGKQIVVLSGIGGMGKTRLASEIVKKCNENGYLRCPQIIHVQEMGGSGGALHTIVESASYERSVYDSLAYLNESERFDRKLKALCELPEYVLLVLDNYNTLKESELSEVISRLKCKLLITTRAKIEPTSDNISSVKVGCMDEKTALKMFCELLGSDVSDGEFHTLYSYVGGHTITLCIIAKTLKAHKISISELIGKMDYLEELNAKIEFRHNEYGDSDTVLGHLKNLFRINKFDKGCINILRQMSLLSDGTISTRALMEALSLKNRNEIITLTENGWLEVISRDEEYLYLHPILSHLMAKLLHPSTLDYPMISHILYSVADEQKKLTYESALILCERLYYAIYVIADSSGELCEPLWRMYAKINHIIGDSESTQKAVYAIATRLTEKEGAERILAYSDMLILEQHPTRVAIYDNYLDTLAKNTRDYKWVMRCLSVTVSHILEIPDMRPQLEEIIEKAFFAASEKQDDFAVAELLQYSRILKNRDKILSAAKKYIRKRKTQGVENGDFLYLEQVYLGIIMYPSGDPLKAVNDVRNDFKEYANTTVSSAIKLLLKHPVLVFKGYKLTKKAEALPEADPMKLYFTNTVDFSYQLASEGQINVLNAIEMVINLHNNRLENGTTLQSAAQSVRGIVALLDGLPIPKTQITDTASLISDGVDLNSAISVSALSSLQVSAIISEYLGDRRAVAQSLKVLKAVQRVRPRGHGDIIHAAISYADNCYCFEANKLHSLRLYFAIYKELKNNNESSSLLSGLARKLLNRITDARQISKEVASELFGAVTECFKETDFDYQSALYSYAYVIFNKLVFKQIDTQDEAFQRVLSLIEASFKNRKRLGANEQNQLLKTLHACAAASYRSRNNELSDSLIKKIKGFSGIKSRAASNTRKALYAEITCGIAAVNETDAAKKLGHYRKLIDGVVKSSTYMNYSSTYFVRLLEAFFASVSEEALSSANVISLLFESDSGTKALRTAYARALVNPFIYDESSSLSIGRQLAAKICEEAKKQSQTSFGISFRDYSKMRSANDFIIKALASLLSTLSDISSPQTPTTLRDRRQ